MVSKASADEGDVSSGTIQKLYPFILQHGFEVAFPYQDTTTARYLI